MTNRGLDHTVLVKWSRRFSVPIINGSPGIVYSIRECQRIFPCYLLNSCFRISIFLAPEFVGESALEVSKHDIDGSMVG